METKWTTNQDGFVKAIENNEYAEYELDDGTVLITDVDSTPYIVAPESYTREDVIEVTESDHNVFEYDEVDYDESNSKKLNASIWHIYGFKMLI